MKIFIVNTLYPPSTVGGAERSVALLARAAARRGHEVHVASLHDDDEQREEQDGDVTVHRLPLRNLYWPFDAERNESKARRLAWHARDRRNPTATRDLVALMDRIRPDVLHTNNLQGFSTEIWAEAKRRNIRIVHTLRDYSLLCARASLYRAGYDCVQRCIDCKLLTGRKKDNSVLVDAVASNSQYVIDTHRRHGYFNATDARVIFNIADVRSAPTPAAVPEDGGLTFGFIGRVEPEKGIEVVLAAFARLERSDWQLVIAGAGKGSYVADLQARYPDPRIRWLGFVNADDFYAGVDVVIISSTWPEPLPRTMIDCLARGKTVIYSDGGGTPEIGHLAPLGAVYAKDDDAALAARLTDALESAEDWRTVRAVAPEVLEAFSEAKVVGNYLNFYAGNAA